MSDNVKGRRIKGGIRASRTYDEGRVCKHAGCETTLSRYNRREYCYNHAPVRYPRLRGRIVQS